MKTFDNLWELNPLGNKKETEYYANEIIKMYDENYDNLFWKYKDYLNWWMVKYGDRDPKYVRKSDELKSIYDFLSLGMRNQSFVLPKNSRDYYYFGDTPQRVYENLLAIFKNKIERK